MTDLGSLPSPSSRHIAKENPHGETTADASLVITPSYGRHRGGGGINRRSKTGGAVVYHDATHNDQYFLILMAALRILSPAMLIDLTTLRPFFTTNSSPALSTMAAHFGQSCFQFDYSLGGAGIKDTKNKKKKHDRNRGTDKP